MNSREIVTKTIDYDNPVRLARSFAPSDIVFTRHKVKTLDTQWRRKDGVWRKYDEWGNLWGRIDSTSKGEVVKGCISDLKEIESLELPDYSNSDDYKNVKTDRTAYEDFYLVGKLGGLTFSVARKMRRMDQYLMDLVTEPDLIHALHDRIDELIESMIINYADAGVDAVMFWEDWGTQQHLLISPQMWRAEFLPRFQRHCKTAHNKGIKIIMHSCGQIGAIVDELAAAGIDVFQFDQPRLHGFDRLAEYQDTRRVTIWSPVDIQDTLQSKKEELIRADAAEMVKKLFRGRGGFIAGFYEDEASIGLDSRWQEIAADQFIKSGC
ncbi:methylcobalamin:coenzyme M methyltransferase [Limihaloglobus sulfuriphilus]|uniref:Methylcobalamin:coenzyme M methyltransferase n=1 Tax=Limihaloglobus sulfuriphilus TaxID=1851148 RepID=A0A1Q2MAQ2_9BACT|nr:uroporphyrinogen decarboxylase family protein [Limihaloglobus sulfuriphilus]AQQ69803.1 methylcobalamin:coenzyme M methyltransferase [Limihaloglobus sulfuriphilus]